MFAIFSQSIYCGAIFRQFSRESYQSLAETTAGNVEASYRNRRRSRSVNQSGSLDCYDDHVPGSTYQGFQQDLEYPFTSRR